MRRISFVLVMITVVLVSVLSSACSGNRQRKEIAAKNAPTAPTPVPLAAPPPPAMPAVQMVRGEQAYAKTSFVGFRDAALEADVVHNTEEYGQFEENPFLRPGDN